MRVHARAQLEELKAGIQERLRSMGVRLREQVAAGEITEEDPNFPEPGGAPAADSAMIAVTSK